MFTAVVIGIIFFQLDLSFEGIQNRSVPTCSYLSLYWPVTCLRD